MAFTIQQYNNSVGHYSTQGDSKLYQTIIKVYFERYRELRRMYDSSFYGKGLRFDNPTFMLKIDFAMFSK